MENDIKNEMSFLQRVTGVIFSPQNTMKDLVRKPRLLFPFLLVALSQVVLYLLRLPLFQDYLVESTKLALEMASKASNFEVTPQMIESTVDMQRVIAFISTPIASLFAWVIFTAILFGILKIFKAEGSFKQFLSVTGYAYVITALNLLITLVVSFFSGSLHLTMPLTSIGNLLPTSLAGSFIYGFVRSLDIFSIWYYAVIGIGIVQVSKLSKAKVYITIFAMFTILLVIAGVSETMVGQLM